MRDRTSASDLAFQAEAASILRAEIGIEAIQRSLREPNVETITRALLVTYFKDIEVAVKTAHDYHICAADLV